MVVIKSKFIDLKKRIIAALLFFIIAYLAIISGGLIFCIFISICFSILLWEIIYITGYGRWYLFEKQIIVPLLGFFVPILQLFNFYPFLLLSFIAFLSLCFKPVNFVKFCFIIYVGTSILLLQGFLVSDPESTSVIHFFFVLCIVGASDIGGYFFGKIIGGRKLFTILSPKKTWSGSIGGLGLAILTGTLFVSKMSYSVPELLVISLILAIAAQGGDILESALKRNFSVKDSGFVLPGHGGLFDRLDGLLLAVPVYILIYKIY